MRIRESSELFLSGRFELLMCYQHPVSRSMPHRYNLSAPNNKTKNEERTKLSYICPLLN
jgi:hypothetical protein